MPNNLIDLIRIFTDLIRLIIPVIIGLALLAFFWGLVKFIVNIQGDVKAVKEGKNLMIWGVIAFFVMISVWGILAFFSRGLGFNFGLPLLPA